MNKPLILLPVILFMGGCQSTFEKAGYIKKDAVEKQLIEIQSQNSKALEQKEAEIKGALGEVIASKDNQLQRASNSLFGATLVKPYLKEQTRPLIILLNRVDEARAALGLPPTLEAMKSEQERLVRELDETLTSLDDLKKDHEEIIRENQTLVQLTREKEELVKQKEEEKLAIERAGNEKLQLKQRELNELNDKLIAAEKKNSDDKKYIEANKRLLMISLGACSLAALLVAIYLPLFRKEAGYFSAITGGVALCIPFIQPLHINITLLCGAGYVAFLLIRRHLTSHKTNENLVNFVQDIKDQKPELYKNELKPLLGEWNTKYVKGGEKVEDKVVTNHIDEILRDYERK